MVAPATVQRGTDGRSMVLGAGGVQDDPLLWGLVLW